MWFLVLQYEVEFEGAVGDTGASHCHVDFEIVCKGGKFRQNAEAKAVSVAVARRARLATRWTLTMTAGCDRDIDVGVCVGVGGLVLGCLGLAVSRRRFLPLLFDPAFVWDKSRSPGVILEAAGA